MPVRPSVAVSAEIALRLFIRLESDSHQGSVRVANGPENQPKNRWSNVLPFDNTRIKLKNKPNGDYINASLVSCPGLEDRKYILTQGPLPETVPDFWSMVWQEKCANIVMLCRLTETGMCKCARYWPVSKSEEDVLKIGAFKIRLVNQEVTEHFVIRQLEIELLDTVLDDSNSNDDEEEEEKITTNNKRLVKQLHYLTWPDFGVPKNTESFLEFLERVPNADKDHNYPNVVHCSAGIGRSGTFTLVDTSIELMRRSKKPLSRNQILDNLGQMRTMRMGLIQTPDQLRFSLQAIEDAMSSSMIEFEPQDGLGASTSKAVMNGATLGNRKRSTDANGITGEGENDKSSENEAKSDLSDGEVTDKAVTSSKRPKANC